MTSRKQMDLELDATGIQAQLTELATRAVDLGCRWLATVDPKTMESTMDITDETVVALLQQAAAVQHLIDKLNERKH